MKLHWINIIFLTGSTICIDICWCVIIVRFCLVSMSPKVCSHSDHFEMTSQGNWTSESEHLYPDILILYYSKLTHFNTSSTVASKYGRWISCVIYLDLLWIVTVWHHRGWGAQRGPNRTQPAGCPATLPHEWRGTACVCQPTGVAG